MPKVTPGATLLQTVLVTIPQPAHVSTITVTIAGQVVETITSIAAHTVTAIETRTIINTLVLENNNVAGGAGGKHLSPSKLDEPISARNELILQHANIWQEPAVLAVLAVQEVQEVKEVNLVLFSYFGHGIPCFDHSLAPSSNTCLITNCLKVPGEQLVLFM